MTDYREVRTTKHEEGKEQRAATFKLTQVVWLLVGLLEAALALRLLFKLIGVNEQSPFARLLYGGTDLFLFPFTGLLGSPAAGNMVLEISTIIAMVVYLLIGWALAKIIYVALYRPRGPVQVKQTVVADHDPLRPTAETPGLRQTSVVQSPDGSTRESTVTEHTEP